jgi:hypothetical protein
MILFGAEVRAVGVAVDEGVCEAAAGLGAGEFTAVAEGVAAALD